ncbi:MAG: universal stress protein [Thermaerobacter sp.]|nr:universal stress protein [Thermaerobacter sp.]
MDPMTIVLASDGSPCALRAADWVASHFDPATCAVRIITVVEPLSQSIRGTYIPLDLTVPPVGWNLDPAEVLHSTAQHLTGFHITPVARDGDPVNEILLECQASRPDLLVVGHRGLHGLERFFMGSVAKALVHRAGMPVLVIQGQTHAARETREKAAAT